MKIYFVEDEVNILEIICKYLIRENYDVIVFYDGEIVMEYVGDLVDLWILDIMLIGEIDGFDLIKVILKVNLEVVVIFILVRD